MKVDRFGVNLIWQYPACVIISAQAQLLLLISGHPPVDHAKSSIFSSISAAIQHSLEMLPGDVISFLLLLSCSST